MTSSRSASPPFAAAGVDVGSNSVLLTVARRSPTGALTILDERSIITRLGQGLRDRGALSPEAASRTLAVLEEFGVAIVALGAEARAAGTSALRRAEDADEFLERAREALGLSLEVLSGAEEARLGYLGALSDLEGITPSDRPVLVDPGGGSTEVIRGGEAALSLETGAVRLTETFVHSDPPADEEITALRAHVVEGLSALEPAGDRPVVAAGGTATTLAALALGLERYDGRQVHGFQMALSEVVSLRRRLAALSLVEREEIPCLPPGRADVAVAGAVLLEELISGLGVDGVTVSDRGLRFGLIEEILSSPYSASCQV